MTGLIGQYPVGGVTWDYLQYLTGLVRLGHDVVYLEDTGQWPYNPQEDGVAKGCEYNVAFLGEVMHRFGLDDRWAYRFPWQDQWFGMDTDSRKHALEGADLLLNVSGTLARPQDYRMIRRLAYIDSDPVFTQIKLLRGQVDFRSAVDAHDVQFSFGERLAANEALGTGHDWRPTRQPVVLADWAADGEVRDAFTTVMNWTSYKDLEYNDQTYGQKDLEFLRFLDLPQRVAPANLEVAVSAGKTRRTPYDLLRHRGWTVVDPAQVSPDFESYRTYLAGSKAEWSVAKNGYVRGQPGWFSCRSACYLAAGRPVAVQDTGLEGLFPLGEGLLTFREPDEAETAILAIDRDWHHHSAAARQIAQEHFDSDLVLTRLLDEAMSA